jgi:hypothetical protein
MKSCRSHLINKLRQRIMNDGLGNSKGNFIRIAVQCGVSNDDALHKFIDIVRRRIDAAYGLGRVEGVEELRKSDYDKAADSYYASKDAARTAWDEADATAARYMEILTKQESK